MNAEAMLLEGLHIPVTTPFHPDGRLFARKLEANLERYSKTPTAGLIVLGGSGEGSMLTDEETREVLRVACSAAAVEKVLMAGVGRDSVAATLAMAGVAAELDYDAILIGLPAGLDAEALGARGALTYFQTIADRSPLPVVLSSGAGRGIAIELVVELAEHPRILGMVDAAADGRARVEKIAGRTAAVRHEVTVTPVFAAVTARMKRAAGQGHTSGTFISADALAESLTGLLGPIDTGAAVALLGAPPVPSPDPTLDEAPFAAGAHPLRTRTKTVGFQMLAGATGGMLDGLRAGAVGSAPAFAACAPQACYEVYAAWKDGDMALAEEKQMRLREAAQVAEAGAGELKFGCDLNGYFGGVARLPLLPPARERRAQIERLMKPLRN